MNFYRNDIFILLQPTSPLRSTLHINDALKIMAEKQVTQNLVSITKVNHPIEWTNTIPYDLSLKNFISKKNRNKRSNEFPSRYIINGSIYILKVWSFLKEKSFA